MANKFKELKGSFSWTRTKEPELSPFTPKDQPPKYQWKTMFRPDQDQIMEVMDLQAMGVKNKLSKDEEGYYINFSRPTEIKTRKGPMKLDPPKVFNPDGTECDELIGNGSKGSIVLELYEHSTPNGGTSHAARFYAIKLTELVKYEGRTTGETAAEEF